MDLFGQPERVPVPLTLDDYNEESLSYAIEMRLPIQVTLNPEFEAMVHDECIWNAHRRGLIPIGQVLVTTRAEEKKKPKPVEQLEEGKPMEVQQGLISGLEQQMRDRVKQNHGITSRMLGMDITGSVESPVVDACIVRAEVMIGSALG